jgi:hypothetical protein
MYHISDLKKYRRCPHLYLQEREVPFAHSPSFIRLDQQVSGLAAEKLGAADYFQGTAGDPSAKAMAALGKKEWLVKARFEYDRLRVKVPFLHALGDGAYEVYFLAMSPYPMETDIFYYCATIWALTEIGLQIKDMHLLHFNGSYVRGKDLDPGQLFTISDCFYNSAHHPARKLADEVHKNMQDLRPLMDEMDACRRENLGAPVYGRACGGRNVCRFVDTCFPDLSQAPDNSILTLVSSSGRFALAREGKLLLKDADPAEIEGTRQQYAQVRADQDGGLFVDRGALSTWLDSISYPISFLDFEWERYAIPPYEGMRPFDVLPFEYSLHVEEADGTLHHQVFLSVHDDRREMVEALLKDLPKEGSIVAYNAEGAEKIRLQEFADAFPQYRRDLEALMARMVDLQLPFLVGTVYDTRMRGSWTLKRIMSMMGDKNYADLDIHEGMAAVYAWRHLDRDEKDVDAMKITEELKAYCGMDTYAMTVVLRWLRQIAENPS